MLHGRTADPLRLHHQLFTSTSNPCLLPEHELLDQDVLHISKNLHQPHVWSESTETPDSSPDIFVQHDLRRDFYLKGTQTQAQFLACNQQPAHESADLLLRNHLMHVAGLQPFLYGNSCGALQKAGLGAVVHGDGFIDLPQQYIGPAARTLAMKSTVSTSESSETGG